jgi:hypothetical protein
MNRENERSIMKFGFLGFSRTTVICFSTFVLIFTSLLTTATADVLNSSDYPGISRSSGSIIVQYEERDSDYRFILGSLKKINGVLVREKEQNLNGRLYRITYKVPERFTPQEAFSHIDQQIVQLGGSKLFQCVNRACGSSNQWANKVFGYSRLYGFDESQSFASYQLDNQYFSLYSVQRGNKQIYLRLEVLVTKPLDFQALLAKGLGVPFGNENEIPMIKQYMVENSDKLLWLVGRNNDDVTTQEQLARANESVTRLKSALIEQGVDAVRIKLHSLGGFAPERDAEILMYVE